MEIELNKSFKERVFHAVIFEVTANVIIALSLAWLMNVSVLQSGSLSVISALTATVCAHFSFAQSMRLVLKRDLSSP